MDIDLLSKMVKELILDNDRVVLPGLGCFVAEIVPSSFSDRGYTINPPYRKLSFRARPERGEELARFYADTNNVSYDAAEHIMNDFVSELKTVLHQKKTVVFPGLGRLRATKENTVFFVADENLDIYPAGFGLEPISLKTHQQSHEEVSAAIEGLRAIIDDNTNGVPPFTATLETVDSDVRKLPDNDLADIEQEFRKPVDDVQELAESAEAQAETDEAKHTEDVQAVADVAETATISDKSVITAEVSLCPDTEGIPCLNTDLPSCPVPKTAEESAVTVEMPEEMNAEQVKDISAETSGTASADTGKPVRKIILWTIAGIAVLLVAALAVYMALAIYAPEFLDSLLYTPEELDIINYKG